MPANHTVQPFCSPLFSNLSQILTKEQQYIFTFCYARGYLQSFKYLVHINEANEICVHGEQFYFKPNMTLIIIVHDTILQRTRQLIYVLFVALNLQLYPVTVHHWVFTKQFIKPKDK